MSTNNQTPAQVDPIELRKKLRRMGIGAKFQFSQTAAMDAVTEAMGSEGDPEVEIDDITLDEVAVTGDTQFRTDVEVTCPHCGKDFTAKDVEVEGEATVTGDVDVDSELIAEHIHTNAGTVPRPTRLEPHEIAYMVNAWSLLWDAPT